MPFMCTRTLIGQTLERVFCGVRLCEGFSVFLCISLNFVLAGLRRGFYVVWGLYGMAPCAFILYGSLGFLLQYISARLKLFG